MSSTVFVNSVTLTAASWFQDQDNAAYQYLSAVAGTNTITATGPAGLGAYAAGLKFRFIPAATNTGATTINITGTAALGARNIFNNGAACVGGELNVGMPVEIVDDGTRFHLIPLPKTLARRKTADQSVTSSTVLTDDTHLTFPIAASEEWTADYFIDAGASMNTTGLKVSVTTPSGATQNIIAACTRMAAGVNSLRTTTSGTALDFITANWATTDPALIQVSLWVLNGATPGTITLQFAQSTSTGTALTFRKGSHMNANRIA